MRVIIKGCVQWSEFGFGQSPPSSGTQTHDPKSRNREPVSEFFFLDLSLQLELYNIGKLSKNMYFVEAVGEKRWIFFLFPYILHKNRNATLSLTSHFGLTAEYFYTFFII